MIGGEVLCLGGSVNYSIGGRGRCLSYVDVFDIDVLSCSKILTTVVSTFTSYYVHLWSTFFPSKLLTPPLPSFDGRVVLYPSTQTLRDYMSWRQVDCKI